MAGPTAFPELNGVLEQLVAGSRRALGDNLVGIYLQGSFAVGDADEHSDVDFVAVTERELTDGEQRELQALHERLFELPSAWAQHLEGSYVTREQLRRVDPARSPWFYFHNGATTPIWDRSRARRSRRSVAEGARNRRGGPGSSDARARGLRG